MATKNKKKKSNKRGVSLLIAVGISSLIMVFAVGVSKIIVSQLKSTGFTQSSNAAFYAAEGALELVLLKLKNQPIGYNVKAASFELPIEADSSEAGKSPSGRVAKVSYNVRSKTGRMDGGEVGNSTDTGQGDYKAIADDVHIVPAPWIGDAYSSNCSPDLPPKAEKSPDKYSDIKNDATKLERSALEHPCNWNKIRFGETATIPLYYLDANNKAVNPSDPGGISKLTLKMRTPCKSGKLDDNGFKCGERYKLHVLTTGTKLEIEKSDATLINWQISAFDKDGMIVNLLANNERDTDGLREMISNSEIHESKVNSAASLTSKYGVFSDSGSCDFSFPFGDHSKCSGEDTYEFMGSIMDFLKENKQEDEPSPKPTGVLDWDKVEKNNPVLKFTVIHPLFEDKDKKVIIPHLEYQLVTDKGIASNVQLIDVEAEVGGFKQAVQVKRPVESSVLEFAVHN